MNWGKERFEGEFKKFEDEMIGEQIEINDELLSLVHIVEDKRRFPFSRCELKKNYLVVETTFLYDVNWGWRIF